MVKFRIGFVSNSSSASFVIDKDYLDLIMIARIKNHIEEGSKMDIEFATKSDEWAIMETDTHLKGDTYMDNFDMRDFFDAIGIRSEIVTWGEEYDEDDE